MAYRPIGDPARWKDDIRRGDTWSVLPAYTVEGLFTLHWDSEGLFQWRALLGVGGERAVITMQSFPRPSEYIVAG